MPAQTDIRSLVERIAAEFRPERIILFGSRARGGEAPESDVDILVVLPVNERRARLAGRIRAGLPTDLPIDIVVRTPEQVAAAADGGDPLLIDALAHGIELYRAAA